MLFASNCVVVVASVPHRLPLHPVPERLQLKSGLGFEFGAGVNVATMAAEAVVAMLVGPESCNAKLLVIVSVATANFEGSAALCARTTTLGDAGKICGAV